MWCIAFGVSTLVVHQISNSIPSSWVAGCLGAFKGMRAKKKRKARSSKFWPSVFQIYIIISTEATTLVLFILHYAKVGQFGIDQSDAIQSAFFTSSASWIANTNPHCTVAFNMTHIPMLTSMGNYQRITQRLFFFIRQNGIKAKKKRTYGNGQHLRRPMIMLP